jgi:hypothetical protein
MPHINYFNSFKELNEIVKEINPNEISKNMEIFNTERKVKIYNIWSNLLKKLL